MSRNKPTRDIQKVAQKLFREIWKLAVSVTKDFFQWLFRSLLVTRTRQRRTAKASGFVLPTVVLLLLVVGLVIGAILFRTGSRTNQVISERAQQVIYNAATPAIDRAKAKLEYLFRRDDRLPNTVPSEDILLSMLLNDGRNGIQVLPGSSPYIFPGETDITLRNGANVAPAWRFKVDGNNNGTTTDPEDFTVAYSIIFKARDGSRPANDPFDPRKDLNDRDKATQLYVRNGPITASQAANPQCRRLNAAPESGWDLAGTAALRKTFQVNAVVVRNNSASRTITTLEFQQDRELARANKWGAWFRYDMHLSPFPPFKWNGALHTEGSLFLGGFTAQSVQSYLISSPESCLYSPDDNSRVSIGRVIDPVTNAISFAGQIVRGRIFGGEPSDATFHIWDRRTPVTTGNAVINAGNDSFNGATAGAETVASISLDPVFLFTQDRSRSNDPGDRNNVLKSTDSWRTRSELERNSRVRAKSENPPYVDDTYRADDRLGPKPRFDLEGTGNDFSLNTTLRNGTPIVTAALSPEQRRQLTNNDAPALTDPDYKTLGLDGYWERRARAEGMRIIVGQRLELGDLSGWGEAGSTPGAVAPDALYPLYDDPTRLTTPISHLQQQLRALKDNLSAVQATVVYHRGLGRPDEPIACIATTAHPGTQETINRSKNFDTANGQLSTNFFTGKGTNGWEYPAPPVNLGGAWDTAIKNLANFAGEADGAFPPNRLPINRVYPQPYLSMWGNFSNLRRSLEFPITNPVDGQPPIADRSYQHTAACTMGMLAQNMVAIQTQADATPPDFNALSTALAVPAFEATTVTTPPTSEAYLAALTDPTQRERARLYSLRWQIERDRRFGFAPVPAAPNTAFANYQYTVQFNKASDTTNPAYRFGAVLYDADLTTETATNKKTLSLSCNFREAGPNGNNFFGFGAPANATEERRFIRLAVSLCSDGRPSFPSLYYLFPTQGRARTSPDPTTDANELYILKTNPIPLAFGGFQPLDPTALATAMQPKPWGGWILPTAPGAGARPNPNDITLPGGGLGYVALRDSVIFDGREMLPVRLLDVDLELLRNTPYGSDRWLPNSGVIYAFREDAVREDGIARPGNGVYNNPTNPAHPKTNATNTSDPRDPDLVDNGISPKPVDFFPDPDRRPYGFRLRNGADVRRDPSNSRGLTFISDNTVAIQGDFNKHTQYEFGTTDLDPNFNEPTFYNRTPLNENFASLTGDAWRPSEILSDAIVMLSSSFNDGNIEAGFRNSPVATRGHSYRGLGTLTAAYNWIREDGSVSNLEAASPIKIGRNGNPLICSMNPTPPSPCPDTTPLLFNDALFTNPNNNLFGDVNRRQNLNAATATEISSILVGAVVPTQQNQGNGGIHNFPRMLENWDTVNLKISGSFIQLNFSTAATGPFEQDLWEPSNALPTGGEQNNWHYRPPNRVWGYDVGLQYAPAGPLSKRFITSQATRSEFYEEPRANDPYICLLRRAIAGEPGTETPAQVNQECE